MMGPVCLRSSPAPVLAPHRWFRLNAALTSLIGGPEVANWSPRGGELVAPRSRMGGPEVAAWEAPSAPSMESETPSVGSALHGGGRPGMPAGWPGGAKSVKIIEIIHFR